MRALVAAAVAAQGLHLLDLAVRAIGGRRFQRAYPDAARDAIAAIYYHEGAV